MENVTFLSVEDVLLLHTDTIDVDGGSHGVRDHGLSMLPLRCLVSSLAVHFSTKISPRWLQPDLFHIAQNHPFIDGNKRAAVMSSLAFLLANGIEPSIAPQELEVTTLKVAAGELSKEKLTKWMRARIGK